MGSKPKWPFFLVIFTILVSSLGQSSSNFTRNTLDSLVQDYAFRALARAHTGVFHETSLPANLPGVEASVVRFRSRTFWSMGVNFSAFAIPPKVLPVPHVKRVGLVFQNLGNWSSYYSLEGFSLVTPVVGFLAYDASHLSENGFRKINLNVSEGPISIHFPQVELPEISNLTLKCVQYGADGSVTINDITLSNVCFTRVQGHFSIVAPLMESKIVAKKNKNEKKKETLWKCSVIGFTLASIGLIAVASITMMTFRYLKAKKVEEMERKSDGAEVFNYVWIGDCKCLQQQCLEPNQF